ncbi:MAG: M23 family metallopeptidase [Acidobacteriota bacterium]
MTRRVRGTRGMRSVFSLILLLTAVALLTIWLFPALRHPLLLLSLAVQNPAAHLPVPVEGVRSRQLADSWGGPRPGGRHHQGIDIFAKRGQPVLAATPGIVMKVGTNELGGQIVKVLGPGLEWHYYAHLDRFGSFRAGSVVKSGDILGYVGNTGDARTTPCHLHYGIYSRLGVATNPYPRLALPHS